MAIATTSQILETLENLDLKDLLDKMEDYVRGRFYDKTDQNKNGLQFQDFCQTVLMKACDGTRKWDMGKGSFENFIFGTLRSDLNYFFKKGKVRPYEDDNKVDDSEYSEESYITDVYYSEDIELGAIDQSFDKIDDDTNIQGWISSLKEQGSDNLEIEVFECWTAGIKTPKEVAEYMDLPIKEINNIYKRLRRKKIKLDSKWISLQKQ